MILSVEDKKLIRENEKYFSPQNAGYVIEMLERKDEHVQVNAPVALTQCSIKGQFSMLKQIKSELGRGEIEI